MSRHQLIDRVNGNLPGQRQPPGPDSTVGIIVSQGAKPDVLIRVTIRNRKHLLYPLVESLGKQRQVVGSVEFRIPQLLWLRIERSVREWNARTYLGPSLLPSL